MTLTLLHKRIKFAKKIYVYRNFGLKIKIFGGSGTYRRSSHTGLSCIVSCVGIKPTKQNV